VKLDLVILLVLVLLEPLDPYIWGSESL